jgi:predicted nucleotidyltransferase
MTAPLWEAIAKAVLERLSEANEIDDATVVLIGSVARQAQGPISDVDILIISPRQLTRMDVSPAAQVFVVTRERLLERLRNGDDFPQWVARFGKVLSDKPHWWKSLTNDPALKRWPDWERKRGQAAARLSFATRLHASGDSEHAAEEFLLSARHLARALLLKERVFPLSQPELAQQLRGMNQGELADLLNSLIAHGSAPDTLAYAERVLKKYIASLTSSDGSANGHKEHQ